MTIAQTFQTLVAKSSILPVFIDNVEEKDYGCTYLFDGKMECAVIDDGDGNFLDGQDINISELETNGYDPSPFKSFASVEELVAAMESQLSECGS
jgi:hypothetical protein